MEYFEGRLDGEISLFAVSSSLIYVAVSDGSIWQSTDGGTTFNLKAAVTSTGGNFVDIHFTDADTGYVNADNRIYKTTDGGASWQVVVALANATIVEIYFNDATHGWACTNKGEVVKLN